MAKAKSKQQSKRLTLSVCCWNVDGLITNGHDKLLDSEFLHKIQGYDIIGLVETHNLKPLKFSLASHKIYHSHRIQDPRSKRTFGGISILIRKSLVNGINVLPGENSSFMWIKLSKTYFNLQKDLYISFLHIPPVN